MILWIIKWIFISTLLISLTHYLYSFFENILSVPKMKDLQKLKDPQKLKDLQKPYPRDNDVPISIPTPEPIAAIENNPLITNTNINKNMETELEEYLKDITKHKTENHIRNTL